MFFWVIGLLAFLIELPVFGDVIINEISYNPAEIQFTTASDSLEFIELYNPGTTAVNLSGYNFTKGITYTFPEGTSLNPNNYLLVVSDPKQTTWKNKQYPVLGPYTGTLSDNGERLTLVRPDKTIVDEFKYSDSAPWPHTPDGYGPSLERIAWDLPSDDFHSWRSSLANGGTPGAKNSVIDTPPRPMITGAQISPQYPASKDAVTVQIGFDAADTIESATLQWQKAEQGNGNSSNNTTVFLVRANDRFRYFKGKTQPSEGDLWTKPGFDDSRWTNSNGGFGYGNSYFIGTKLNDMKNTYSTVYTRKQFNVKNAKDLKNIVLEVFYTGGYVCYLNGTEVASANVPKSVTNESLALRSHSANEPDVITISDAGTLLTDSNNTIAIIGVNNSLSQNNFVIATYIIEGERQSSNPADLGISSILMQRIAGTANAATFEAMIPAATSQTLIRYNARVALKNGKTVVLPHVSEIRPYESYFVYDNEIKSLLPIVWPYYQTQTNLTEMARQVTGVVIQPTEENTHPLVYDGALVYSSRNGHKIKFLKGEEYKDYRTFVLFPETSQGGTTAGASTSYRENLSYWLFNQMGVFASRTTWFRVVLNKEHGQQLLSEQVNKNFYDVRKLNSDTEIFKLGYQNPIWENHGHLENGTKYIDALLKEIKATDPVALHTALTNNLTADELLSYSATSVFTSNWDGFFNNQWWYLNPDTGKWLITPWDLDKTWGFTDDNPMFVEMPLAYPLDGKAKFAARSPGPILGPFHKDNDYNQRYLVRLKYEMDHKFSEKFLYDRIDEVQKYLLDDLALQEEFTAKKDDAMRKQITDSYTTIKDFIKQRRAYLIPQLSNIIVPVEEWSLYE